MARISINALPCTQNGVTFYVSVMNSKELKHMCFVSRKKDDPNKGFQRLLSKKRAIDIANYLDKENGIIPPALILSAQPSAQLVFNKSRLEVTMENAINTLLVLDGQHRLYGLMNATAEYDMPVVIFDSLNSQQEVRQFIDINTTQKGVTSALILDIKGQAGRETKVEERQRILFDKLKANSVLSGYLSPNESGRGKISRTSFNQATKAIFETGRLASKSDDFIYGAVNNYLNALDSIFKRSESPDAKLSKNNIFRSFMHLFNEIFDQCIAKYSNFKTESIIDLLMPLTDLDYSKYTGTNKATEARIIQDVRSALREEISLQEDIL